MMFDLYKLLKYYTLKTKHVLKKIRMPDAMNLCYLLVRSGLVQIVIYCTLISDSWAIKSCLIVKLTKVSYLQQKFAQFDYPQRCAKRKDLFTRFHNQQIYIFWDQSVILSNLVKTTNFHFLNLTSALNIIVVYQILEVVKNSCRGGGLNKVSVIKYCEMR